LLKSVSIWNPSPSHQAESVSAASGGKILRARRKSVAEPREIRPQLLELRFDQAHRKDPRSVLKGEADELPADPRSRACYQGLFCLHVSTLPKWDSDSHLVGGEMSVNL
jgi:hypothetical protein